MKRSLPKSFKAKLIFFFMLISTIPLILAIVMNAMNMISDARENVEKEGDLRNRLAREKISELYEKNLYLLRTLAKNPIVKHYLLDPDGSRVPDIDNFSVTEQLLQSSNDIFGDNNNMIVTNTDAQQLIRTDGLEPVNVNQRKYFWDAMNGSEAISEVVTSLATGRFISVVEVPIFSDDGKVIGLIQRDYDLSELQEFVESLATENTRVFVLDREGRLIAHSSHPVKTEEDRLDLSDYSFVNRALTGETGHSRTIIDDEESLVSFSKNQSTGWAIVTVQPGSYIMQKVYSGAFFAGACGIALLLLISVAAYFVADKIAQPIIALNRVMLNVANHDRKVISETSTDDEVAQMVTAVEHIKTSANALREESETDQLTHLLNKITMEKICRTNLRTVDEDHPMALFIIDLDHFKEANDTRGHQYGDKILQEFSKKLKGLFRSSDFIGRFGGDEFVVLLPNIQNQEFIPRKASQILQLAKNLKIDGESTNITASIGVAIALQDGVDYETLFDSADKSLYQVKRKGRDGFCLDRITVFHE